MGTRSKLAIACLLLTPIAVVVWIANDREASVPATEISVAPQIAQPEDASLPIDPAVPTREVVRVERDPDARILPAAKPRSSSASDSAWTVHVRANFVDESGQPLARVWFCDGRDGHPSTRSGPDGAAELALYDVVGLRNSVVEFTATHEGRAMRTLSANAIRGQELDLGTVFLERECRIRGIVHNAAGSGIEGASVGLCSNIEGMDVDVLRRRSGPEHFELFLSVRSDEHGEFELREVPAGSWRLWSHGSSDIYSVSELIKLEVGDEIRGFDFPLEQR